MGIENIPGSETSAMYIEYDTDTYGDNNWMGVTAIDYAGGVDLTRTDLGVAVAANTWYVFRIRRLSSSVEFYVDDVLKATNTDNLPTGTMEFSIGVKSYLTPPNRIITTDYWSGLLEGLTR